MDRNYWQQYWENYYKFMAMYLREFKSIYPNGDIKQEYLEMADLFEPSMPYVNEYNNEDGYIEVDDNEDYMQPNLDEVYIPYTSPGSNSKVYNPSQPLGQGGQSPTPFISPGGGQFTINNCKKMAIVRIDMKRGFNPSNFFMVVDRSDSRSIQGFRIVCESNRIRFVAMAVEYRNINLIECVF